MATTLIDDKGILSDNKVDEWKDAMLDFLLHGKFNKKRQRLTMMTFSCALDSIQAHMSPEQNTPVRLKVTKTFFGFNVRFESKDVDFSEIDFDDPWNRPNELADKVTPTYRFENGKYIATARIPLRNTISMLNQILISLALAVITIFASQLLPAETVAGFNEGIVTPIMSKLMAVFQAVATPLVFFSVIGGICSLNDIYSFGKIGVKFLKNFFFAYGVGFAVAVLLSIPLFQAEISSTLKVGSGDSGTGSLFQLVLDMIPNNLVEPFGTGNLLQVVVIAIFFGIVLLLVQDAIPGLKSGLAKINNLFETAMLLICKTIPLLVYLGIVQIGCGDKLGQLASSGAAAVLFFGGSMIIICIVAARIKLKTGCSIRKCFKDQLQATLINLTTSSQVTSYPESYKCCVEKWHVPRKIVDFSLPVGMVTYMPCGVALLFSCSIFVMKAGGEPITLASSIFLGIICVVVAIAAPPIPGSGMVVMPLVLNCVGVSNEFVTAGIVLIGIIGYFVPLFNGYLLQLEVLSLGHEASKDPAFASETNNTHNY